MEMRIEAKRMGHRAEVRRKNCGLRIANLELDAGYWILDAR